jgi:anionic cell wall polymer biosynthesis LytR-Cps2A-Psr (LCP) family protein
VSGKHSRPRPDRDSKPAPTPTPAPPERLDVAVDVPVAVALAARPEAAEPFLPAGWDGGNGDLLIKPAGSRGRGKKILGALLVLALIVAVGVAMVGHKSGAAKVTAPVASVGSQTTLLIQLSGSLGTAVDSALVAHDPATHQGLVVLVPSEVVAQVPGFGAMPFGQALTVGDPEAPRSTLSDLIGVTVDASWTLSPVALQSLVDRLGGLTVTVDRDVTSTTKAGAPDIVVPAGTQKLNGASVVAFATFLAANEPEQSRLARFDTVLSALLAALPPSTTQVTTMLGTLGTGSVSSFAAVRLAGVLTGLAADDKANTTVDQVLPVTALDTGDDQQSFTVDATKTAALVSSYLAAKVPANRKVTGNRVLVENQVGSPGIGESTRDRLSSAGFVYEPGPNAPGMPDPTSPSVVLIFTTTAADIARGDAVAKALGLPASDVKVASQQISVADVIAIIGADYKR